MFIKVSGVLRIKSIGNSAAVDKGLAGVQELYRPYEPYKLYKLLLFWASD